MKTLQKTCICIAALLFSVAAFSWPPPEQCPQPRFTDRAPDTEYSKINPLAADKSSIKLGKHLYLGKDGHFACANCHGKKGKGNGPLASQFNPRPRNFACAQTVNSIPDGQLFWIIQNGSPGTAMPPHLYYSEIELWQIVLYLRQLATP